VVAWEYVNAFHAADAESTLAAPPASVKPGSPMCWCRSKTVLRRRASHFRKKRQSPKLATKDVYRKPIAGW